MSAKMDGVHTRTPQQLEQKLDLGKRFAEVMGIATDARDAAEEAQKAVDNLDEELTAEEVYNRLTNNGQLQGLYRDQNGNLLVNAEYIYALEKLFAKDITMSGTFTHKAMVFLEPGIEEVEKIQRHIVGAEIIPIYDFPLYDYNGDGKLSLVDMTAFSQATYGQRSLADWSGAVKTEVTLTIDMSNPDKFIRITGKNMWGRDIDQYVGVNFTNIKNPDTEQRLEKLSKDYIVECGWFETGWYCEKWASGKAVCWGTTEEVDLHMNQQSAALYYTTHTIALPSDFFTSPPYFIDVKSLSHYGLINVSLRDLSSSSVTVFVSDSQERALTFPFMVKAIGIWQ